LACGTSKIREKKAEEIKALEINNLKSRLKKSLRIRRSCKESKTQRSKKDRF
tara:strand:- start:110 stop:265 length:156 start_codon:yes stop_codon:yes gene_type:complete